MRSRVQHGSRRWRLRPGGNPHVVDRHQLARQIRQGHRTRPQRPRRRTRRDHRQGAILDNRVDHQLRHTPNRVRRPQADHHGPDTQRAAGNRRLRRGHHGDIVRHRRLREIVGKRHRSGRTGPQGQRAERSRHHRRLRVRDLHLHRAQRRPTRVIRHRVGEAVRADIGVDWIVGHPRPTHSNRHHAMRGLRHRLYPERIPVCICVVQQHADRDRAGRGQRRRNVIHRHRRGIERRKLDVLARGEAIGAVDHQPDMMDRVRRQSGHRDVHQHRLHSVAHIIGLAPHAVGRREAVLEEGLHRAAVRRHGSPQRRRAGPDATRQVGRQRRAPCQAHIAEHRIGTRVRGWPRRRHAQQHRCLLPDAVTPQQSVRSANKGPSRPVDRDVTLDRSASPHEPQPLRPGDTRPGHRRGCLTCIHPCREPSRAVRRDSNRCMRRVRPNGRAHHETRRAVGIPAGEELDPRPEINGTHHRLRLKMEPVGNVVGRNRSAAQQREGTRARQANLVRTGDRVATKLGRRQRLVVDPELVEDRIDVGELVLHATPQPDVDVVQLTRPQWITHRGLRLPIPVIRPTRRDRIVDQRDVNQSAKRQARPHPSHLNAAHPLIVKPRKHLDPVHRRPVRGPQADGLQEGERFDSGVLNLTQDRRARSNDVCGEE